MTQGSDPTPATARRARRKVPEPWIFVEHQYNEAGAVTQVDYRFNEAKLAKYIGDKLPSIDDGRISDIVNQQINVILQSYVTVIDFNNSNTGLDNQIKELDDRVGQLVSQYAGIAEQALRAENRANEAYGIATRAQTAANSASAAVTSLEGVVAGHTPIINGHTQAISGLRTDVRRIQNAGYVDAAEVRRIVNGAISTHGINSPHYAGGVIQVPVQPPHNGDAGNHHHHDEGRRSRFAGCLLPLGILAVGAAALGAAYLLYHYGKPEVHNSGQSNSGVESTMTPYKPAFNGDTVLTYGVASANISGDVLNAIGKDVDPTAIGFEVSDSSNQYRIVFPGTNNAKTYPLSESQTDAMIARINNATNEAHVFYDSKAISQLKGKGRLDDLAKVISGNGEFNVVAVDPATGNVIKTDVTAQYLEGILPTASKVLYGSPNSTTHGITIVMPDRVMELRYSDGAEGAIAHGTLFPLFESLGK